MNYNIEKLRELGVEEVFISEPNYFDYLFRGINPGGRFREWDYIRAMMTVVKLKLSQAGIGYEEIKGKLGITCLNKNAQPFLSAIIEEIEAECENNS